MNRLQPAMDVTIGVMIAGLIVQGVALVVAGVWKLGQMEAAIRRDLAAHQREVDDKIDAERRILGETLSALRQKINDVELEAFKTFARRDSFREITAWIEKVEAKLDRVIERYVPPTREP